MKRVKIYQNQEFEQQTEKQINEMAAALQLLLIEFNALNVGKVTPEELVVLSVNPQILFDKKLEQSIEVPKGLSRSKYIELLELPKLGKVLNAQKKFMEVCVHSLDNFRIVGDFIEIIPERLEIVKDSQSVYVVENSKEHEAVKKLLKLRELANELNPITDHQMVSTGGKSSFECVFKVKGTGVLRATLEIDRAKLVEFIKRAAK